MSSRPILTPHLVITNGDMSGNLTSLVSIITNITKFCYQCVWTGTSPVGQMIVEISNDYKVNNEGVVVNAGNWTALQLSGTATVSGNSDSGIIEVDSISSYAIRVRYARTSGTGTLNVTITGKVA